MKIHLCQDIESAAGRPSRSGIPLCKRDQAVFIYPQMESARNRQWLRARCANGVRLVFLFAAQSLQQPVRGTTLVECRGTSSRSLQGKSAHPRGLQRGSYLLDRRPLSGRLGCVRPFEISLSRLRASPICLFNPSAASQQQAFVSMIPTLATSICRLARSKARASHLRSSCPWPWLNMNRRRLFLDTCRCQRGTSMRPVCRACPHFLRRRYLLHQGARDQF